MVDLPPELLTVARAARRVVVLTGAGISAESGLRTFRGSEQDMASLWAAFDPMKLATVRAFQADPATVTGWYDWRRLGAWAALPNPGHLALARWQERLKAQGGTLHVVTQNVDGLHQRAGATGVLELHGSILRWRCTHCGVTVTPPNEPLAVVPWPSACCPGELYRPDVVWFGETLPSAVVAAADAAVHQADLFLTVGTSAVVYPAAGFIHVASARGIPCLEINPEVTPVSSVVRWSLRLGAGAVLPQLAEAA